VIAVALGATVLFQDPVGGGVGGDGLSIIHMKSFLSSLLKFGKSPLEEKSSDSVTSGGNASLALPVAQRNPLKDKLYGNLHMDQWPPQDGDVTASPWSEFVAARNHMAAGEKDQAIAWWQAILVSPDLEVLHYAQAWHFLRQNGVQPSEEDAKGVYGVIGEQGASGVMTAVFLDGQARLYGDQGQAIVWTHPDASLDPLIETVLGGAVALVHKMKQSDPQLTSSKTSINSISILTPSGVYTKTGTSGSFEATPLIKPIAEGLGLVIKALMEKASRTHPSGNS
jgi:hypothetical protein